MNMSEPIHMSTNIRGELRTDEPMSRHVSWRAGGNAKRFFKPADLDDLRAFLPTVPTHEPILFVGLGSNLLVRDGGFDGTVILTTPLLGGIALDAEESTIVVAGAGAASPHVAKFAAKHGLEKAEWLAGVPGTVGGALAMNAGCYGTETWEQIVDCVTLNRRGELHTRTANDFEIGYRHVAATTAATTASDEEFFVSARFRFVRGDAAIAQTKIKELLAKRMAAQPLDKPNAGSTFRNPPGDFAARLIESCGLKGFTMGGAQVSTKHANFIINTGSASAADIEQLIDHMQATVARERGVTLVREVRIVGDATPKT
jgi:UDP-N-acetylmuramate dehydrogenase